MQLPDRSTLSFQAIMDETLALQIEEAADVEEWNMNEFENVTEFKDMDEFNDVVKETERVSDEPQGASSSCQADLDFALALQLQEAEEAQYDDERRVAQNGMTQKVICHSRSDEFARTLKAFNGQPSSSSMDFEQPYNEEDNDIDDNVLAKGREKAKGIRQSGRVERAKHATNEAVLDTKTRLLLLKLMNHTSSPSSDESEEGYLANLHGILRTGKEANVYAGDYVIQSSSLEEKPQNQNKKTISCVVKIFRTTLSSFRNRLDYVKGDFRYPQYPNGKKSQQVQQWTHKEYANLCRAQQAGLATPTPLGVKDHVLMLSLIPALAKNPRVPAPQLRELTPKSLSRKAWSRVYLELVSGVRQLYQVARLVHADLSPYNVLVGLKKVWFIDFGQSVDVSHPEALMFLERDMTHILTFMRQHVEDDLLLSLEEFRQLVTSDELVLGEYPAAFHQLWTQLNITYTLQGKAKDRAQKKGQA